MIILIGEIDFLMLQGNYNVLRLTLVGTLYVYVCRLHNKDFIRELTSICNSIKDRIHIEVSCSVHVVSIKNVIYPNVLFKLRHLTYFANLLVYGVWCTFFLLLDLRV